MITLAEWHTVQPVTREDGETVGYVLQRDERWLALTLLGTVVGERDSCAEAEQAVRDLGLSWMIERMWCRIPRPLTIPELPYAEIDHVACEWERVAIVEVTRTRARIRPEHSFPKEAGCYVEIVLPVSDAMQFIDPDC